MGKVDPDGQVRHSPISLSVAMDPVRAFQGRRMARGLRKLQGSGGLKGLLRQRPGALTFAKLNFEPPDPSRSYRYWGSKSSDHSSRAFGD